MSSLYYKECISPVANQCISKLDNDSVPLYVTEKKTMQMTFSDKDSFGPLLQEAEVST